MVVGGGGAVVGCLNVFLMRRAGIVQGVLFRLGYGGWGVHRAK